MEDRFPSSHNSTFTQELSSPSKEPWEVDCNSPVFQRDCSQVDTVGWTLGEMRPSRTQGSSCCWCVSQNFPVPTFICINKALWSLLIKVICNDGTVGEENLVKVAFWPLISELLQAYGSSQFIKLVS